MEKWEDFKSKWVAALRSGEYKQGKGSLYWRHEDAYCCIGVAGAVCGIPKVHLSCFGAFRSTEDRALEIAKEYNLPAQLMGDLDEASTDYNPIVKKLANMNDDGYSFQEIADWIEQNL